MSRVLRREAWGAFLVRPETLLRWHRQLVARKWTRPHHPPGRPALPPEVRELILRLGRENPRWGYQRIRGELLKLGMRVSATTIATLLRRHGLGPTPRRGPTWSQFLRSQAAGILACDFLTVETVRQKTLYVLVWIELGTRRVHLGGATSNPDSAWVAQQARNSDRTVSVVPEALSPKNAFVESSQVRSTPMVGLATRQGVCLQLLGPWAVTGGDHSAKITDHMLLPRGESVVPLQREHRVKRVGHRGPRVQKLDRGPESGSGAVGRADRNDRAEPNVA